jgi:hypothetical protein
MKRFTLLIGLIVAATILFAQDRRDEMRAKIKNQLKEYKERLDLNDKQVAAWKKIREKYKPELEVIRDDVDLSRGDKMRAAADVFDKVDGEIDAILTEDQKIEYAKIKSEVQEKRRKRRLRRGNRDD